MSRYGHNGVPNQGLADLLGIREVSGDVRRFMLRLISLVMVIGVVVGTLVGFRAAPRYIPVVSAQVSLESDDVLDSLDAEPPQPIDIPDLKSGYTEPVPQFTFVSYEENSPGGLGLPKDFIYSPDPDPGENPVMDELQLQNREQPGSEPKSVTEDETAPIEPVVMAIPVKARIALIIDDLGLHQDRARQIADLPVVLTLSWLPYAAQIKEQTQYGFNRGHQIFAHVPMQPGGDEDPGPNALMSWHGRSEIRSLLDVQLSEFVGLTGINNHMGSKFTSNRMSMTWFMAEVKTRDLLFVDSLTSAKSEGASVAKEYGLPFIQRDFFIDHDAKGNAALVEQRFIELEALALERGEVVAIAHPYTETIAGLQTWIPAAQSRGIEFITVSRLSVAKPLTPVTQVASQE